MRALTFTFICAALLPRFLSLYVADSLISLARDLSLLLCGWFCLGWFRKFAEVPRFSIASAQFLLAWCCGLLLVGLSARSVAASRWYFLIVAAFIVGHTIAQKEKSTPVLKFVSVVLFANSLLAALQFLTGFRIDFGSPLSEAELAIQAARFGAAGGIGFLEARPPLGIALALGLTVALMRRPFTSTLINSILSVALLLGVAFSLSRSSWVAAVAVLFVSLAPVGLLSKVPYSVNRSFLTWVLAGLGAIALFTGWLERASLESALSGGWGDSTLSGRTGLWGEVLAQLTARGSGLIFGLGPGSVGNPSAVGGAGGEIAVTDSTYLRVLAELGLVGLSLFLVFCLSVWVTSRSTASRAALIALAAAGVTVDWVSMPSVGVLGFLLVGLMSEPMASRLGDGFNETQSPSTTEAVPNARPSSEGPSRSRG